MTGEAYTLLAHNYVRQEVQDAADIVGDSLELAFSLRSVSTEVIVFAGVDFMAEMAALLSPGKRIIHPEPRARCPMAAQVTPEEILAAKRMNPGVPVVTYVNSSVATKAVSDIICTSSNAVRVVESLDADSVIFTPDRNLGTYVARRTGKKVIPVPPLGCCPVHHALCLEDIREAKAALPGAEVIVHPEVSAEVHGMADFIGSTSALIRYTRESPAQAFIVGTEEGVLPGMRRDSPQKRFISASPFLVCPNMKMITMDSIQKALANGGPVVKVDEQIAKDARRALERMTALG